MYNENARARMKSVKFVVGIGLTLCYFAGLLTMLFHSLGLGLLLWVISTVGGMGFLYYYRQQAVRDAVEEEARRFQTDGDNA